MEWTGVGRTASASVVSWPRETGRQSPTPRGTWTLDNVPGGDNVEVSIRLSHPDYISDYKSGTMQELAKVSTALLRQRTGTIVMARGTKVAGTVTDPQGNPVAGAVVALGGDPYSASASVGQKTMVRTDSQGSIAFRRCRPWTRW